MCQISVQCPHCGTVNKNLYLYETEGWFECEACGNPTRVSGYEKPSHVVCTKCGCDDIKYRISYEGEWVATCQVCGHEQKLQKVRNYAKGSLLVPVFEMDRPLTKRRSWCRG